jgi:predicted TIM-barrel fold metal-dependent hydrolase
VTGSLPDVAGLALVDHHCHGVVRRDLDRAAFEELLTEGPPGTAAFDSRAGLALRRWCAPVLDLPAHAPPERYLARRADLGHAEVTARMLRAAGLGALCVDTGYTPEPILDPDELATAAGAPAYRIVRLERMAEEVAASGVDAASYAGAVRAALAGAARGAVGFKSIAAYRAGLALSGERPDDAAVRAAAGRLLSGVRPGSPVRVADEVLHRFLFWCAVDLGRPVQFHVGYGDRDVDLHRCDPLLLTGLLRAAESTGVPVLLLHNYPYHRQAGYLAQVYRTVYVDVGLAAHNVGDRAGVLLAELLELAPFGKVLFSSDAYGLPELYALAATLFRRALSDLLGAGVSAGAWTGPDARRYAGMIAGETARRVYRLP